MLKIYQIFYFLPKNRNWFGELNSQLKLGLFEYLVIILFIKRIGVKID